MIESSVVCIIGAILNHQFAHASYMPFGQILTWSLAHILPGILPGVELPRRAVEGAVGPTVLVVADISY
jgi:hypothetical protein